jgi:uncharacterized protein (DUF1697 family)
MPTWIALLRGINVGGNNLLPMKVWASQLADLGCKNVRTYIQSGNAVFENSTKSKTALQKKITAAIEASHGFAPKVLLLNADEIRQAIDSVPFPKVEWNTNTFHFFFLAAKAAKAKMEGIAKIKAASEEYRLTDSVFYLYAPDGIGRSKLAAGAEKLLGVDVTARNGRTVEKLMAMAEGV